MSGLEAFPKTRRLGVAVAGVLVGICLYSKEVSAEAEEREIVDRVVAVVGAAGERGRDVRLVTAFELEVEARLLLAERAHSVRGATTGDLPAELLETTLQTTISHLLIEAEAARLQLVSVSRDEIEAERRQSEERISGENALERFQRATGAPDDLLSSIYRRRALVTAFIQQNIQLSTRATEEQVEAVYESGDHPFGDRPLEEIRGALEAFITARSQRERLAEWLEDARARSRIRLIPP